MLRTVVVDEAAVHLFIHQTGKDETIASEETLQDLLRYGLYDAINPQTVRRKRLPITELTSIERNRSYASQEFPLMFMGNC